LLFYNFFFLFTFNLKHSQTGSEKRYVPNNYVTKQTKENLHKDPTMEAWVPPTQEKLN